MLKRSLALISCLLSLTLLGCSSPIQTGNSSQEVNVIIYEADTSSTFTNEIISSMKDPLTARFKSLGFESIVINQAANQVRVELTPSNPDIKQIAEIVGKPNRFKLVGPNNEIILFEKDLISATPCMDETYKTFEVRFTDEAEKKLETATQKLIGQRVSFYLDDRQLANLLVANPISGEGIQVPGSATVQEAKILTAV
ncbi:hypothetical protein Desde_0874 [Desulfitobacterium dehalogenans ATCC 51507]|uniref:SecDF P1 head subdomain domain-containing protein n=1 Tax=Desulfitobacterium dehalogenans (strain ATCC 51507 / DSM 9161 / JW/IU-DC1) TaxID=756499 RepID=I4A5T0_DESDJ|nr:hypothetical protein [Desulfitobacterium dehalogenans]AFL99314.1 hypothetical protein Desde_0874 [Desulfitobacterium dehalogenans ATCC 51507]